MKLRLNNKGQTLVEYVLIISLITVVAVVKIFGGYLKDRVTKMGCEMMDKQYVEGEKIGEGYCQGDEGRTFAD